MGFQQDGRLLANHTGTADIYEINTTFGTFTDVGDLPTEAGTGSGDLSFDHTNGDMLVATDNELVRVNPNTFAFISTTALGNPDTFSGIGGLINGNMLLSEFPTITMREYNGGGILG